MAQTLMGSNIYGEFAHDQSGTVSMSADGSRLAIGAPGNDGNGSASGHMRVYQWSGTAWEQVGADIDGEAASDEASVVSLSADGLRVALGARYNDGNGANSGHVRVFEWSVDVWQQLGTDIDGEAEGDESALGPLAGQGVSLSGDGQRLAIGAQLNDGNGNSSGHVRIYQWSGDDWQQLGADIDGEVPGDRAGVVSLSANGSRVAIGAPFHDGNGVEAGTNHGHARVFQWSGADWQQLGPDIDGESHGNAAGSAVSISSDGKRLAIGAPLYNEAAGRIRVFQWEGAYWQQLGAAIDGEESGDRNNEISLSANGYRLVVGARFGNDQNTGQARIFEWAESSWQQIGVSIDGGPTSGASLRGVSISADGKRVAIGDWHADRPDPNGLNTGDVRVFSLTDFPQDFLFEDGFEDY